MPDPKRFKELRINTETNNDRGENMDLTVNRKEADC